MSKVDSFGDNGVEVGFTRQTCLMLKNDLADARALFSERHLGNNKTMQKEKAFLVKFIHLASLVVEDEIGEDTTEH